jgi:hypothetical protein
MKGFLTAVMIAALPAAAIAQAPLPVGSITVSAPTDVATLDLGKLKGEPSRLGWSPDHKQIYLQTLEGTFHQPKAIHHYLVDASSGKVTDAPGEPAWFNPYWAVKSHKSSPDTSALDIDLTSENRVEKTTNVPRGGDLARGGVDTGASGSTAGEAIQAAATTQTVTVHTMKLHGQVIGEFINSVIVPGLTFAWAPAGAKAIAYTDRGGKLILMSAEGKRQEVAGTKDALLPMWSADATKLAWLQKDGKKKVVLKVADLR